MALSDQIQTDVQTVINTQWSTRKGQVVPSSDSVALAGGAVELDAVHLYADLASSSKMAKVFDRRVVAKILKSFHSSSCRIISSLGGQVASFDGDRVLGIFVGSFKNSNAAKCALQINYAVTNIIRPQFEAKYDVVKNATFKIGHGVGIDSGTVLAVRAGARGANDLIWIGRAPNLAAKLSDLRESPYNTHITATVYNCLNEESKFCGKDKSNMWEPRSWSFLDEKITVYRSNYYWKP